MLTRLNSRDDKILNRLQAEVLAPGLCTHCGTCAGLSNGALEMRPTSDGPLPYRLEPDSNDLPTAAFEACPGKGINYPELCAAVFGRQLDNWLIGCWRKVYIGFSTTPEVRRAGASGGVITQTLIHLLESGLVDGAVVVRQGRPRPWEAEPFIATTVAEIMESTQSVYVPVPVNSILRQMEEFAGRLAYVGMPDQVASLRQLRLSGHEGARKADYILGPYFGMGMYFGAIESFLRSNKVAGIEEVTELRYREGEWPGYLQVKTRTGKIIRAAKFYYNYLIPFYVTRSSLMSVDFSNELADISVGDAWHPRYEQQGQGFSVVVARSERGEVLLDSMCDQGSLDLQEISLQEALSMHGHMLDFKKRGAFIRMGWRKAAGKAVPDYGYRPRDIRIMRKLAELVIFSVFALCATRPARRLVEFIPLRVLGPTFSQLRKTWKRLSKPTKRQGLYGLRVDTWSRDETEGQVGDPGS